MNSKRQFCSKVFFYSLVVSIAIFWGGSSFGFEWSKTFGGSEDDSGNSVQQTNDGGYIITGTTDDSYYGDVYLIKTDADGNEMWSNIFGEPGEYDRGSSVQQTSDGGFIIVGSSLIKTDADGNQQWSRAIRGNFVQQTTDGGFIIVDGSTLIKTDVDGNQQWRSTIDGVGNCVQQTSDGGYIVTGKTINSPGWERMVLIKTDNYGNTLWRRILLSWKRPHGGEYVQQTSDGGFIVVGRIGREDRNVCNNCDVFLVKTDSSGWILWDRAFGEDGSDIGREVQQTADGGYIVVGSTSLHDHPRDVFIIKTNRTGYKLWSKRFGGDEHDDGNSIQQTNDGGYIISGTTNSYGAGGSDVYLIYFSVTRCNGNMVTIYGSEGPDVIDGTEGPDVIHGLGGIDVIRGMGGDDVICGGDGSDVIGAGSGNDIVLGENGHDAIWGGPGNDILLGGDGNDSIYGGPGNDELRGNHGNDSLYGISGIDELYGGWGPNSGSIDNNDTCYDTAGTFNPGCEVFYEQ